MPATSATCLNELQQEKIGYQVLGTLNEILWTFRNGCIDVKVKECVY